MSSPTDLWTALMCASENGHLYLVRFLILCGKDPNAAKKSRKNLEADISIKEIAFCGKLILMHQGARKA
ncbi:MAG: ankyrin repeat domain-containing protein [Alphaproteobacteria bacterium]|nr:MAG: ankyrin repeat domain-containing protein [Alphaproteobacteria bacterium]